MGRSTTAATTTALGAKKAASKRKNSKGQSAGSRNATQKRAVAVVAQHDDTNEQYQNKELVQRALLAYRLTLETTTTKAVDAAAAAPAPAAEKGNSRDHELAQRAMLAYRLTLDERSTVGAPKKSSGAVAVEKEMPSSAAAFVTTTTAADVKEHSKRDKEELVQRAMLAYRLTLDSHKQDAAKPNNVAEVKPYFATTAPAAAAVQAFGTNTTKTTNANARQQEYFANRIEECRKRALASSIEAAAARKQAGTTTMAVLGKKPAPVEKQNAAGVVKKERTVAPPQVPAIDLEKQAYFANRIAESRQRALMASLSLAKVAAAANSKGSSSGSSANKVSTDRGFSPRHNSNAAAEKFKAVAATATTSTKPSFNDTLLEVFETAAELTNEPAVEKVVSKATELTDADHVKDAVGLAKDKAGVVKTTRATREPVAARSSSAEKGPGYRTRAGHIQGGILGNWFQKVLGIGQKK